MMSYFFQYYLIKQNYVHDKSINYFDEIELKMIKWYSQLPMTFTVIKNWYL